MHLAKHKDAECSPFDSILFQAALDTLVGHANKINKPLG